MVTIFDRANELARHADEVVSGNLYLDVNADELLRRLRRDLEILVNYRERWGIKRAEIQRLHASAKALELGAVEHKYFALLATLKAGGSPEGSITEAIEECRSLTLRARSLGLTLCAGDPVLEELDEFEEFASQAESLLERGVNDYDGPRVNLALNRAAQRASRLCVNTERYRSLAQQLVCAMRSDDLGDMLSSIAHGDRPPNDEETWEQHERLVTRCEDAGVDVRDARAALERCRHVEYRRLREDEDTRSSTLQIARSTVDAHLKTLGAHLGRGDGGSTLRALVWGLLALDESRCVRLEGEQLTLVDHLQRAGALPRRPCERAGRAALRVMLRNSPLVERAARKEWIYHLDQLKRPSATFLAQIKEAEDRLRSG